jgi:hypothetical protein
MGAKDKLIPNAITIANNLHGIKYSTTGTYRQPAKKTNKYNNPVIDAINFISSIYAKEIKIADSNATWNYTLVNGKPQLDVFTPDQNTHHMNLGMLVAVSENEWDELQIAISEAINLIYPLKASYYSLYTLAEGLAYFDQMGIFGNGPTLTSALLDANGGSLGTFNQGVDYATAWNDLKVPADAALGVYTPFIAPIYQPLGETLFFYRYTGKRRWASPFTGYTPPGPITPPSAPVNTALPVITGSPIVGSPLTVSNGTWTGYPLPTFTYQWYIGATPIGGATANTFILTQAQAGNTSNISCQVTATNIVGTATATSNTVIQIFDFNAAAFITTSGVSSTEANAINTLTIALKAQNLWNGAIALYPVVGTTIGEQRTNLVNPLLYQLDFQGAWTHSSTGALPDGTTAYADTQIIPSLTVVNQDKTTVIFYSRTNNFSPGIKTDFGSYTGGFRTVFATNFTSLDYAMNTSGGTSGGPFTDTLGLFSVSRTASTTTTVYHKGLPLTVTADPSGGLPNASIYLSAANNGGSPAFFSPRECAFFGIYNGILDATDNANLEAIIQAFQTTLGRQVI